MIASFFSQESQQEESQVEADYGFYFEEDYNDSVEVIDNSRKNIGSNIERNCDGMTILCIIEDYSAPIACRSFGYEMYRPSETVQTSVFGYRISYVDGEHFTEYQAKLIIGDVQTIVWRSFEQFKSFADAFSYCKERKNMKDERLDAITGAWSLVLRNRPWFLFSPVSVPFHLEEMSLLNKFLNIVLFESPHFSIIEEFFR